MAVGPTIRFDGKKITHLEGPTAWEGSRRSPLANSTLTAFSISIRRSRQDHQHDDSRQDQKTPLGTSAPRLLLGIYRLDGDTLELCTAIDPNISRTAPQNLNRCRASGSCTSSSAGTPPRQGLTEPLQRTAPRDVIENDSRIRGLAFASRRIAGRRR